MITAIAATIVAAEDENTILKEPKIEVDGLVFGDLEVGGSVEDEFKVGISILSVSGYLAIKEWKKRDKLNGYMYMKFGSVNVDVGYDIYNEDPDDSSIFALDLDIYEFDYTNDYFSISFGTGLETIDFSVNINRICDIFRR